MIAGLSVLDIVDQICIDRYMYIYKPRREGESNMMKSVNEKGCVLGGLGVGSGELLIIGRINEKERISLGKKKKRI